MRNRQRLIYLDRLRSRRRLIVLTTKPDRNTFDALIEPVRAYGVVLEVLSYDWLFANRRCPRAAYLFTDFERMDAWSLEKAGKFYKKLKVRGATVLNDPRRFLPRASFLRRMKSEGIINYRCWLPAHGESPDRYPVFLRTLASHRGVASGLLYSKEEALNALRKALARGRTLSDLVFIEYCAEPNSVDGKFRKHACYGVSDTMIRALTMTDSKWIIKYGERGAARREDYERERCELDNYPHEDLMRRVFEIAGADFGRVDFGIVNGRPQIYELNSNPLTPAPLDHPYAIRRESQAVITQRLACALADFAPAESTKWRENRVKLWKRNNSPLKWRRP